MKSRSLTYVTLAVMAVCLTIANAQEPTEDPFGGGFPINQNAEIFTMGAQNDSLHGWGYDWLSVLDSIALIGEGSFPESYQCGDKRDIAAADFDGDFMDELVVAWSRTDGGIFVGIPTIDPETLVPDPAGWHVPDVPIAAGVMYATETLAGVLGEIRVVAGNFYADPAEEFVLAYLASDSTVTLSVFDVDSATLVPIEKATISDQAVNTEVATSQQVGKISRFDLATGDFDGDGLDEIILVFNAPDGEPATDLTVAAYDYVDDDIVAASELSFTANDSPDHTCLRRLAVTAGNFDTDSRDEIAFMDRWADPVDDTSRVGTLHVLKLNPEMTDTTSVQDDALAPVPLWMPINGVVGADVNVTAFTIFGNKLIVGGYITSAGGTPVNFIAAWDGESWSPLGDGVNNRVSCLTVYDNKLIAGGLFATAGGTTAAYIAAWDGSSWSALGSGMDEHVRALTVYDNKLIAGGYFTTAGGTAVNRIAAWDGSSWSPLGSGMSNTVFGLTVYNGKLIAGGNFGTAGGATVNCIAAWNDTSWSALGSGMDNYIQCVTVYDNKLIVGGGFATAGGTTANYIAAWNGTSWSPLGSGMDERVHALTVYDSKLIAGGIFSTSGVAPANRIAAWDGSSWSALGSGMDDWVGALTVYDNRLIAGGSFTTADSHRANLIAWWNGSSWHPFGNSRELPMDITAGNIDQNEPTDSIITDELFITGCRENAGRIEQYVKGYGFDTSFSPAALCMTLDTTVVDSIAAGRSPGDLYTSRRTMALSDVTGEGWADLTMLLSDNTDTTRIEVFELYPDTQAVCAVDSVIAKGSLATVSDNMSELVLADIDMSTIVLGTPSYHLVTDMLQPLVVLNAPPSHFDILDDTVYDVNFLLDETPNPQECETYSVYEKKTGYTMEMSTEVNRDWGVSASLDVSVETPGAEVKAHMGANYGEGSAWAEESKETIEFTLTANAETDDQIFATQLDYQVWEYPILRGGVQLEGGGVVVISPVTSNNIFAASKSSFREQWIPNHEVGNLLSYQSITDDNVLVGSENIICDGTGFVTNDVSDFYWEVIQENFSDHDVEESYTAGMEVGASVSGGGSFFGLGWGVEVSTEFTYDQDQVNTYTTQVTDACQFQAFIGCVGTSSSSDRSAIIIPYAYWANNGALVLDYTVQPSAPGGDPSWWQIHYNIPDPAFILPWRLDKEKGDEGMTEVARYETREIIFHPGEPQPGDLVTITARVHNFSLVPTAGPVSVSFYLGDPDNGGMLLEDPGAQSVFWTPDIVPPQGEQLVTMDWQVPAEGSITRCQQIWAIIDPGDDITPEVHDNDDPRTNNKGWKLLYVDTEAICIDTDGDGYGDPAYAAYAECHTCIGVDNCPTVHNPAQTDTNGDGIGDACQGCCGIYTGGITGNTNCSEDGKLTLSDITQLIDNVYISKNPLCCHASGNTNGSTDCKITLSDITKLIDAVYISKADPETCLPECEQ